MKKFLKFRYGEKGFTLIELLIVVAILGILAAVIVPNIATFIGTGKVAAANTEVANVETAALAFYADNDGTWPTNTNADLAGGTTPYLSAAAGYDYGFDTFGKVGGGPPNNQPADAETYSATETTIVWDATAHKWKKA